MTAARGRWQRRVLASVRQRGFWGSIWYAVIHGRRILLAQCRFYLTWNPWNPWYNMIDTIFDRRFSLETAGVTMLQDLHFGRGFNGYAPTPRSRFFHMLRQVPVEHPQFTFIDFGCGKGKAILLAATLPFRRIIGVELSAELLQVAARNLERSENLRHGTGVELVCADVRDFHLPSEPAVCYFYDPFEADILQPVLENIRTSLAETPRTLYVIYFVPVHRRLLDSSTFLTLTHETPWYCIYRAS